MQIQRTEQGLSEEKGQKEGKMSKGCQLSNNGQKLNKGSSLVNCSPTIYTYKQLIKQCNSVRAQVCIILARHQKPTLKAKVFKGMGLQQGAGCGIQNQKYNVVYMKLTECYKAVKNKINVNKNKQKKIIKQIFSYPPLKKKLNVLGVWGFCLVGWSLKSGSGPAPGKHKGAQ